MADTTPKTLENLSLVGEDGTHEKVYNVEAVNRELAKKQDRIAATGMSNLLTAPQNAGGQPGVKAINDFALSGHTHSYLPLSGGTITGSGVITLSSTPPGPNDAVKKSYVDDQVTAAIQGLDIKASCKAATTGNIALTTIRLATPIDGVALAEGDRVLVKDQNSDQGNGIYVAHGSAAWERAPDFNSTDKVTPNAFTFVEQGSVNQDTGWVLITDAVPTLAAATPLRFSQFSGAGAFSVAQGTGSVGVVKNGGVFTVNHTNHSGEVTGTSTLTIANGSVTTAKLPDSTGVADGVTYAKMQRAGSLSVLGNASNTAASVMSEISASANDHYVLRRSGASLGFGQVATTGIADGAVTDVKIASSATWNAKQNQIPAGTAGNLLTYSGTSGSLGTPLNPAILFGTSPTTGAAKVVTLNSVASGYTLVKGAVIGVTFTAVNTATGNITLAVSGATATAVQYKGSAITANAAYLLPSNRLLFFQYADTAWQLLENAPLGSTAGLTGTFASTNSNTPNRTYPVRANSDGQLGVDVPWAAANDATITIQGSGTTAQTFGSFTVNASSAVTVTIPVAANSTTGQGLVPAPATEGTTTSGFRVLAQNNAGPPVWSSQGTVNTVYLNGSGGWTSPTVAGVSQYVNLASTATNVNSVTGTALGVSGTLPVANGGIGTTQFATGQLLVSNAGSTQGAITSVAGNANTAYFLKSGGANTAPTWASIVANLSETSTGTFGQIRDSGSSTLAARADHYHAVSNATAGPAAIGLVPNPVSTAGWAKVFSINGAAAPNWTNAATSSTYQVVRVAGTAGSLSFGVLNDIRYFGGTAGTSGQYLMTTGTSGALTWGTVTATVAGTNQRADLGTTAAANSVTGTAIGVTGTLPVANGGIGTSALTGGRLLISNTTGTAVTAMTAGTADYFLKATGTNSYTWSTATVSGYLPLNGGTLVSTNAPFGVLTVERNAVSITNGATSVSLSTLYNGACIVSRPALGAAGGGVMYGASEGGAGAHGGYLQAFNVPASGTPSVAGILHINPSGGTVSLGTGNLNSYGMFYLHDPGINTRYITHDYDRSLYSGERDLGYSSKFASVARKQLLYRYVY